MYYINAVELINLCVEHNVLKEKDGAILVYRKGTSKSKEGLYLTEKDILAQELMKDEEGQKTLISELNKKNIEFTPTDYSWIGNKNDSI